MDYIGMFCTYLTAERNLSPNTEDNYRRDLLQFKQFISVPLTSVTPKHITDFIVNLREQGLSVSSTNRKLSSLKTFYKFMLIKGYMKENPAANIESGKREHRLPQPVSIEDIDKITNTIDNLRDKTMIELLYGAGLRREELTKIKVSDIDFTRGDIRVIGKGNVERYIPLNPVALELAKKQAESHNSEWLFPSRKTGGHISKRRVNEIVSYWVEKAGLKDKGITPHKFRHSFGTHLHQNGAELKTIQDMMGHKSANTTQLYTQVSNERNRQEYLKYHPRVKAAT